MERRDGDGTANGPSGRAFGGADRPPNPPIACRALLFDLDGVLVDSTPAVARVWTAWALEHGRDPEDTVRRAHGRPSLATIRELLPDADHEKENELVEQREIDDTDGVVPLPGTVALLKNDPRGSLGDRDLVHSQARPASAQAAGLPTPKHLVTASDITRGKPDPEPYLKGALSLGLPARECVVVEDAPAGVRSGRAAAARVIGLRTTAPAG